MGAPLSGNPAKAALAALLIAALLIAACALAGCAPGREAATAASDEPVARLSISPLSAEEAQGAYMGDIDVEAAERAGLASDGALTERYYLAAAAYMAIANRWLCEEHGLNAYQEAFSGQEASFSSDDADLAIKKNGSFGRENVFMRNTAYVERLSEGDLALLLDGLDGSDLSVTQAAYDMVKSSWRDVFAVSAAGAGGSYEVVYGEGALTGVRKAPSDALVFSISYDIELDGRDDLRETLASMAKDLMESKLASSAGAPVCVLVERNF